MLNKSKPKKHIKTAYYSTARLVDAEAMMEAETR